MCTIISFCSLELLDLRQSKIGDVCLWVMVINGDFKKNG